jgi:hypothetical protein
MIDITKAEAIMENMKDSLNELRNEVIKVLALNLIDKSRRVRKFYEKQKDYYEVLKYRYHGSVEADFVINQEMVDLLDCFYSNSSPIEDNSNWIGKFKLPPLANKKISKMQMREFGEKYYNYKIQVYEPYRDEKKVQEIMDNIINFEYLGWYHKFNNIFGYYFSDEHNAYEITIEITIKGKVLSQIEKIIIDDDLFDFSEND